MDRLIPTDLISPKCAARVLRVHVSTVYRWIKSGELRAFQRRLRYLVSQADAEAMLSRVETGTELRAYRERA